MGYLGHVHRGIKLIKEGKTESRRDPGRRKYFC